MPRGERRAVSWALTAWILLVAAGFGWQWTVERRHPGEEARLLQKRLLLEEEIQVLEAQKVLLSRYGNIAPSFFPVPGVLRSIDLSPRRRSAYLNVGSDRGVRRRQVVVCDSGLVGIVEEVGQDHAWVLLADDVEFRVRFTVHGAEESGIAQGVALPRRMRSLFHESAHRHRLHDLLETSGGDGIFPPGLLIGRIVGTDPTGRRAEIELPHDPARVRAVVVLTRRERS